MAISTIKKTNLHWNYFIALEQDFERASRYIEFHDRNLEVFSIELAHLLFAAASEVDVLAKRLCTILDPATKAKGIDDYRGVLMSAVARSKIGDLPTMHVSVPRYGLSFPPWENWATGVNPDWWRSYNCVKHQRDTHFQEANLRHTLNAMGALLMFNCFYYRFELNLVGKPVAPSGVFKSLGRSPALMMLDK